MTVNTKLSNSHVTQHYTITVDVLQILEDMDLKVKQQIRGT